MECLTEMLKGALEGSVLEILSRGETYGYEIPKRLNALGFTYVVEGTVYTILIRLEKTNWWRRRRTPQTSVCHVSFTGSTQRARGTAIVLAKMGVCFE